MSTKNSDSKSSTLSGPISRRSLLQAGGFAAALGMPIPFIEKLAPGIIPAALAQAPRDPAALKPGLTILGDRPLNMETPPHLLDEDISSGARMFVRNNGLPPILTDADIENWRLVIDGEVENPLDLSIVDLQRDFETVSLRLQIECAGNGRRFMKPAARGNQWSFGAISCAEWTGVRLRDVLLRAGLKKSALYTAHHSADTHLSGDPKKAPISRGIPIIKALEAHTLIAFGMNGTAIPALNGHPLRLVASGWPGSCSQKWLTGIEIRDRVHDGAKMTGQSYRVPAYSVAPGTVVPDTDMRIIEALPVKSLITAPQTGVRVGAGVAFDVRGAAWAGDLAVAALDISVDFGASWTRARLDPPANKYAWQRWRTELRFAQAGYYEIWARARDEAGNMQPAIPPGWNPRGYLNNMQHRIAVFA
ncbi:MAG: sulfite oxidase, partial [Marinicaulis sp.]|nr:sulfite oxidase [Marinicaulis sp.]